MFADREWGRATTIMKKQGLLVLFKVIFDVLQQSVGKIAVTCKKGAILEINKTNFCLTGDSFGFFGKSDVGMILLC